MVKTVVVLGAAYGGFKAARTIAQGVPEGWRVIVIDRNTHINHAYILPRLAVVPGHEHKGFVPLRNVFQMPAGTEHPHLVLHAHVKAVTPEAIILSKAFPEHGIHSTALEYDYAVYALGSRLPEPLNLWNSPTYQGTKREGTEWLRTCQKDIEKAGSVLVVGGGALGIQFATDINALYPTKPVTLLHSRRKLLPRFDPDLHYNVLKFLESVGIDTILGQRLDLASAKEEPPQLNEKGQRVVRTLSGRKIAADLIMLCTGQQPNSALLKAMDPDTVNPEDNLIRVTRKMQLTIHRRPPTEEELEEDLVNEIQDELENASLEDDSEEIEPSEPPTPYPHIFVVGDCADAFGALQAGHTAYYQGMVAANNILKLVRGEGESLEDYQPGMPGIKVSLGMTKSVYQSQGVTGVKEDGVVDMRVRSIWESWGMPVKDDDDMYQ